MDGRRTRPRRSPNDAAPVRHGRRSARAAVVGENESSTNSPDPCRSGDAPFGVQIETLAPPPGGAGASNRSRTRRRPQTMRYMVMHYSNEANEAGAPPSPEV